MCYTAQRMLRKLFVKIIAILFVVGALFASRQAFAELTQSQALQQESNELQAQLADIESQIAQYEQELKHIGAEKNTLTKKLKQLQAQQAKLKLQIREISLRISGIERDISDTQIDINTNEQHLEWLRNEIGAVIKEIAAHDRRSFLEVLLSDGGLSAFSRELNDYKTLSQNLATVVGEVKEANAALQARQEDLAAQREEQQNYIAIIDLQNQELAGTIKNQNSLLAQTKGKENVFQAALSDTQKKAAQIKSRIYDLFGMGKNITFGDAVQIAQWVSAQTGVRAAFLLAILTQESNLGKNVGTCNRAGDPPSKSWKVIMKPARDQEPFQQITAELGLDPDTTPVSCPMRAKDGSQIGWGGAMGPAQFIPSTWMGYKDKISAVTGKTADPWDIRDAFIASAVKLAADGATSESGEWAAAMRYFSGSTNSKYSFYGDNVVKIPKQYAEDIADLEK